MRTRWWTHLLCAAVWLAARVAGAEPRVVLVETKDSPQLPGLAAEVQLHAGRGVVVTTTRDADEGSTVFAARAAQLVAEQGATIVVWVSAVDERTFLVYAAGRWPGRALIELVRLDAATPPNEIERTVALKIAGLFDTILAPRPLGAALGVPIDAGWLSSWRLDVSGSIVAEAGDRSRDGRLAVAIDHRWSVDDWAIAAGLGAHWQPSGTIRGAGGTVSIEEVGPDVFVAGEHRLGAWTLFARPHLSASLLLADGTGRSGAHGSATVFSPSLGVDAGARWALSDMVELVLAVGFDDALIRQQFVVDGMITADLRNARASATLGVSVPLR
jgi:hypothetical protein